MGVLALNRSRLGQGRRGPDRWDRECCMRVGSGLVDRMWSQLCRKKALTIYKIVCGSRGSNIAHVPRLTCYRPHTVVLPFTKKGEASRLASGRARHEIRASRDVPGGTYVSLSGDTSVAPATARSRVRVRVKSKE